MGVLAGTWLTIGLVQLTGAPGATSDALGLLLLIAAVAMTIRQPRRRPASSFPPRCSQQPP